MRQGARACLATCVRSIGTPCEPASSELGAGYDPFGTPGGIFARKTDLSLPSGYWRAWWLRSRAGRLTVLHQTAEVGQYGGAVMAAPTTMLLPGLVGRENTAQISDNGDLVMVASISDGALNPQTWTERLGFAFERGDAMPWKGATPGPMSGTIRELTIPYWAMVLLGLPLPLLWLRQYRTPSGGPGKGRCPGCGYDLRGSPERCPECGRVKADAAPEPKQSGAC